MKLNKFADMTSDEFMEKFHFEGNEKIMSAARNKTRKITQQQNTTTHGLAQV